MLVAAGIVVVVNVVAASALSDIDKKPSSYDARFSDDNSLESGVDDNKDVAKFFNDASDDDAVRGCGASCGAVSDTTAACTLCTPITHALIAIAIVTAAMRIIRCSCFMCLSKTPRVRR